MKNSTNPKKKKKNSWQITASTCQRMCASSLHLFSCDGIAGIHTKTHTHKYIPLDTDRENAATPLLPPILIFYCTLYSTITDTNL